MKKIYFVHTLGTGIFFIKSSRILYMFTDVGLALASLESKCRASSIRPCSTKTSTCKNHLSVSTMLCTATNPQEVSAGDSNLCFRQVQWSENA